jgi:hypothetical protein
LFNTNIFKLSFFSLSLIPFVISGCDITKEKEGDFDLACSRWDDSPILCEDYIETDPLSGHIKLWYFEDDPYYETSLFLCGGDLDMNTGHPFQDSLANHASDGDMLCADAEEDDVEWSWRTETCLDIKWDNLRLEIEIPNCLYDDKICIVEGYGYISVE